MLRLFNSSSLFVLYVIGRGECFGFVLYVMGECFGFVLYVIGECFVFVLGVCLGSTSDLDIGSRRRWALRKMGTCNSRNLTILS